MNVRAHALTCSFWAGLAARALVVDASFELAHFDDRVVSGATMHMVDVAARTHMYALGLFVFVLTGLALAFVLPKVASFVGDEALADLENASLVGLVVLSMAGLTSVEGDALGLVAWLEAAYLACAALDLRAFGRVIHAQRGSAFLLVAVASFALIAATPWRTSAPMCAAVAVVSHCALQACARNPRTVDRVLAGIAALAWIPLALVAREELRLWASVRGVDFIGDTTAIVVVASSILAFAFVLARRVHGHERVDAARMLARVALPGLLVGLATLTFWSAVKSPPNEMLEAGNAGLSIQQWFEFGRWPFFDTFDVHGLSDSLFGFMYAWANGWNGVGWQLWDFVPYALAPLAVYALLARVLHSAPFAFAIVVVSPFVRELFPSAFAIVIPFAFVVIACCHARRARAFAWLIVALAFVWLWRMDLGFVCTLACAATFAVRWVVERAERFPWKRAALGAGASVLVFAVVLVAIAVARGVDLAGRARELSRVLDSDQAFGATQIAARYDEIVTFRVFVMPAILIAIVAALVMRARARLALEPRAAWSVYALVFLSVATLVLSTRGLVRHTFVEHVSAYVTGYGFAVLALVPAVWLAPELKKSSFAAFVALHALLPLAFDIDNHSAGNSDELRSNVLARASYRLRSFEPVAIGPAAFERAPASPEFRARNIEPMLSLKMECLAPDETFLDLTASPMLYVYAGARAPHWLNHVITVQGDELQRRFLTELDASKAPLIVLGQDPEIIVRDGMQTILALDGVPLALWHARMFDALMARAEPFRMAGRYEVWSRMDWAPPPPPMAEGEVLGTIASGASAESTAFEAGDGEVLMLCVAGSAPHAGVLQVEGRIAVNGFEDTLSRAIAWPATASNRCLTLCGEGHGLRLERVSVRASGGLEVTRCAVRRVRDPSSTAVAARAAIAVDSDLGPTPRLWGKYDRAPRATFAVVHAATAAPIEIHTGERVRQPLPALSRGERSVLISLDLGSEARAPTRVVLHYGIGELESGSFALELDANPGVASYVFRPGFQPNWHRRPNSWIDVEAQGGSVRLHALALAREP